MTSTDVNDIDLNGTTVSRGGAPPRLPPGALRRLSRLQAVAESDQLRAQQTNVAFQGALAEACDEAGIDMPSGAAQVRIDWKSGAVSFDAGP